MNKIEAGILSAFLGSLLVLGGITIFDDNVYYCEDSSKVMQCDKLTKYYSLETGKCWNDEVGNKLCRSGWIEVENDFEPIEIITTSKPPAKQWKCSVDSCKPVIS